MQNNTAAARPLQAPWDSFDPSVVAMRSSVSPRAAGIHAACLLRGLRSMATTGIDGDGLDGDQCFLLRSSIDTVIAAVESLVDSNLWRAA